MEEYKMYEEEQAALGGVDVGCPVLIHGTVGVEAAVSISPHVEAGPLSLECEGAPQLGPLPVGAAAVGGCTFTVHQIFSVRIPLKISASAQVKLGKTACEAPLGSEIPGFGPGEQS